MLSIAAATLGLINSGATPTAAAQLRCSTTVEVADGNITIDLRHDWAPHGVDRVVALANSGFFDGMLFFRVLPNFLIQFGISPDVAKHRHWQAQGNIADDPQPSPAVPFTDGVVSYAGYASDSRSTHLFITCGDQPALGHRPWEVPIGIVVGGMEVVRHIFAGYGDKPDQGRLNPERKDAAQYLSERFPNLDRFVACAVVTPAAAAETGGAASDSARGGAGEEKDDGDDATGGGEGELTAEEAEEGEYPDLAEEDEATEGEEEDVGEVA